MNVSATTQTGFYTYACNQAQNTNGSSFSGLMDKLRSAQIAASVASVEASRRAAEVREGLDVETLMYLDKYTEIYNRYAEKYGNEFELKGIMAYSGDDIDFSKLKNISGNLSNEVGNMFTCITDAFLAELCDAGIPDESIAQLMNVEDFPGIDTNELAGAVRVGQPVRCL